MVLIIYLLKLYSELIIQWMSENKNDERENLIKTCNICSFFFSEKPTDINCFPVPAQPLCS